MKVPFGHMLDQLSEKFGYVEAKRQVMEIWREANHSKRVAECVEILYEREFGEQK